MGGTSFQQKCPVVLADIRMMSAVQHLCRSLSAIPAFTLLVRQFVRHPKIGRAIDMQLYRSSMITVIHGGIVILLGVAGFSEFFDGAEKRAIADQRVISFVGCAIYVEIKSFYTATIEIIGSELDRFVKTP